MGIQFPPIAFLYLLYFYMCIYILFCTLVKRIIKLKLKLQGSTPALYPKIIFK